MPKFKGSYGDDWKNIVAGINTAMEFKQNQERIAFERWKAERELNQKTSSIEQLLKMGQVAEAIQKMTEAGFISPGGNKPSGIPSTIPQIPQMNIPQGQPSQLGTATLPQMGMTGQQFTSQYPQFVPKGLNVMGVPTGYEPDPIQRAIAIKQGETQVKLQEDVRKETISFAPFIKQFGRSYEELTKFDPEIGKTGLGGWLKRRGAGIANYFDELPETKAFMVQLQPMANAMARNIEGGRVTDPDRKIYADSFVNALANSTPTNIRLASDALLGLKNKGGNITLILNEMYSAKVPIIMDIATQVLEQSKDLKVQKNSATGEYRITKK